VLASTLVIGASMAAAALAPGWLTLAAVALGGAGEGPQLTALLAVRHRETPAHLRGQVYTTAASLKIAGLAAGAALGGLLAGWSVTGCLLIAAGTQLCAAVAYLAAGSTRQGRRELARRTGSRPGGTGSRPPGAAGRPPRCPARQARARGQTDRSVRDNVFDFSYTGLMNRVTQWWLAL
jgi:MFS family permease